MSERHNRKKAREMLSKSGYSTGGHFATKKMIGEAIREHEDHDHPGKKKTDVKFASGGSVDGYAPGGRADRAPRGKKGTSVNIMIAPQGGHSGGAPGPMGGGAGLPPEAVAALASRLKGAAPPGGPMPGPAMGPPPGGPPGGLPAGAVPPRPMVPPVRGPGMPPMAKKGGRIKEEFGGSSGEGRLANAEREKHSVGGKRKKGGDCP